MADVRTEAGDGRTWKVIGNTLYVRGGKKEYEKGVDFFPMPGGAELALAIAVAHNGYAESVAAERDKLAALKKYVHDWLDTQAVPEDPDPERTKATGCRIGSRLEWLRKNYIDTPVDLG